MAASMLCGTLAPVAARAETYHSYRYRSSNYAYKHRAHRKTIKRVGIGAAGGAVVGAIAGGGKGAGIGALAGAGAGYLYDRHKKHQGRP